jgi:hypothetical protein
MLTGCASHVQRMEAETYNGTFFSLTSSHNLLKTHSYAGKKKKGDGNVYLDPYVKADPVSGEWTESGFNILHYYTRFSRAFSPILDVEFVVDKRDTLRFQVEGSGSATNRGRRPSAWAWVSAVGHGLDIYAHSQCDPCCRKEVEAPDFEDEMYWVEKVVHREFGTLRTTPEEFRKIARARKLDVVLRGGAREPRYRSGSLALSFKPTMRRFLDTLRTLEKSAARARNAEASPIENEPPAFAVVSEYRGYAQADTTAESPFRRPGAPLRLDNRGFPY